MIDGSASGFIFIKIRIVNQIILINYSEYD